MNDKVDVTPMLIIRNLVKNYPKVKTGEVLYFCPIKAYNVVAQRVQDLDHMMNGINNFIRLIIFVLKDKGKLFGKIQPNKHACHSASFESLGTTMLGG